MSKFICKYYLNLEISPLPKRRYILKKEYEFLDTIIPKHYITNGANIPRILWSFLEPNNSDILPAIILHDFLCNKANITYEKTFDKELWVKKRHYADVKFLEGLDILKVSNFKKEVLFKSVRMFAHIEKFFL